MEISIRSLIDEKKCYEIVRNKRWPEGETRCVHCKSTKIRNRGFKANTPCRRYYCNDCDAHFDDLTGTIFAKRHQSLKVWMTTLYLMGLNLSNSQIARELGASHKVIETIANVLRQGISDRLPEEELCDEVEMDEVYVVAGHKGNPEAVKKKVGQEGEEN